MPTLTFAFVLVLLAVVSGMFTFDQNNWFVTTWWWWWLCDFSHSKKNKTKQTFEYYVLAPKFICCWIFSWSKQCVPDEWKRQKLLFIKNHRQQYSSSSSRWPFISCCVDENEFFFLLIEFFLSIFFNSSKKRRCNQKAEIYRSI